MNRVFAVVMPWVVGLVVVVFLNTVRAADPPSGDPKPAADAAGAPAEAAEADEAPSYEQVPLFRVGGRAGLPAYLKASAATLADAKGISAKSDIRTVASDFATRDFTFDVVYHTQPGEQSIFRVGIGSSDWEVFSRVQSGGGSIANLRTKVRAINDAEAKVNANRTVPEKLIREGV